MYKVIKKYLIIFSLLIMLAATSCNVQFLDLNWFLSKHGYTHIQLKRNIAGHLTMDLKINGVDGLYILDTGAGATVIDSLFADTLKLKLELSATETTGVGAGGSMLQIIPSKGNTVEINEILIKNFTLSVMNLEHVASAYKQLGIKDNIFGVIGVDLLEPHKAVIDYANMKLWLK